MNVDTGRRDMLCSSMALFGIYALLGEVPAGGAVRSRRTAAWLQRQTELARALETGELPQAGWMEETERLVAAVDVPELIADIRRAELIPYLVAGPAPQPRRRVVHFRQADGSVVRQEYEIMLLSFNPGNFIPPHMHEDCAALHLILEGEMRMRAYDRVATEPDAIIVTATADEIMKTGAAQTMTTAVDNVYWFAAVGIPALALNLQFAGPGAHGVKSVQRPVDVAAGTSLPGGRLRAPFLSWERAMQRYAEA